MIATPAQHPCGVHRRDEKSGDHVCGQEHVQELHRQRLVEDRRKRVDIDDLAGREVVIPGALTTAFLTLRLVLGEFPFREVAFEEIPGEVASGRADLGLLIHEGQLTFSEQGLVKVLDLGEWWLLETGLPLPLGVNVVRRDVERLGELSDVLHAAIECGLDNREEALEYALQFGRGIDAAVADRFVSMYVNDLTKDYGEEGRTAVAELLRRGDEIGAFPSGVVVDWVGETESEPG